MGKCQRQTACEENNNCKKCMGKAGHGFTELTISTCDRCLNTHTHTLVGFPVAPPTVVCMLKEASKCVQYVAIPTHTVYTP